MMTDDIVTQLRNTCDSKNCWCPMTNEPCIYAEAANDIEEYRADLKRHFDMITQQRDEIERLRNDLAEARHEYQKLWDRTSPDYILRKLQDD